MELSVVIPARNEEGTVGRQLAALLGQEWAGDWEIVVVDNGSTDGTWEVVDAVSSVHPRVRLVHEREPGLCHARNAGLGAATAPSVAFCDADDIVADGWVAAMGDALRTHELVCGSQEVHRLNPLWLAESRGGEASDTSPTFHGLFPFPGGNNFGVQRNVIERIGGFDQEFIGAEDAEFGLRAWRAGVAMHHEPGAVVHYAYRRTARELWLQGLSYGIPRPALARMLIAAGLERPPRLAGWKSWVWLVLNSPRAVTRNGRALLAWVAGNRFGHVVGSIRHRTLLL